MSSRQPPSQAELRVQYETIMNKIGDLITASATEAQIEIIYFALVNATDLMRHKLREAGVSESYLRKVEQASKASAINAVNTARRLKNDKN